MGAESPQRSPPGLIPLYDGFYRHMTDNQEGKEVQVVPGGGGTEMMVFLTRRSARAPGLADAGGIGHTRRGRRDQSIPVGQAGDPRVGQVAGECADSASGGRLECPAQLGPTSARTRPRAIHCPGRAWPPGQRLIP